MNVQAMAPCHGGPTRPRVSLAANLGRPSPHAAAGPATSRRGGLPLGWVSFHEVCGNNSQLAFDQAHCRCFACFPACALQLLRMLVLGQAEAVLILESKSIGLLPSSTVQTRHGRCQAFRGRAQLPVVSWKLSLKVASWSLSMVPRLLERSSEVWALGF